MGTGYVSQLSQLIVYFLLEWKKQTRNMPIITESESFPLLHQAWEQFDKTLLKKLYEHLVAVVPREAPVPLVPCWMACESIW